MKKVSIILTLALMAFTATVWAQPISVSTEGELRSALTNQQNDGCTINLLNHITIPSANGEIEVRYRATINMNGKTIMTENATIRIFHVVSQGSLPYIPSLTLTGNGILSGGGADNGGAIYNEGLLTLQNVTIQGFTATNGGAVYNTGTMTMSGGSITGCTASTHGGAIYNKGTLTVDGGTLSSNTGNDAGAIYNESGKTLTINGGTFSNNTATTYSGGAVVNEGTASVNGGTFSGNTAQVNGGAIYNYGTLTMTGGNVNSNTAPAGTDGNGGGVYIHKNGGNFNMSGNPQIYGNSSNNLYLGTGKTITVNGAFTDGANVHVTHADGLDANNYRDIATGYTTYNASTDPATVFHSDNAAYEVGLHTGTTAASLITPTHLYDVPYLNVDATGDHGMATRASCTKISSYTDSNPTLTQGWYVVDQSKTFGRITISGVVNIILADNTILTAQNCVYVPHGTALHIWAQSTNHSDNGGDNMGALFASSQEEGYSCIGGCGMEGAGFLYFHGGYILAGDGIDSPFNSAGIYGAVNFENGYGTNIYGGVIFAWGGENAAGIGSQQLGICGNILITGGDVTALGGLKAAGIGSGFGGRTHEPLGGYSTNPDDDGGYTIIRITGGTVTAIGTSGAGIGGGKAENEVEYEGSPAIVYIDGGTVIARTQSSSAVIFDGIKTGAVAIGWGDEGMIAYNCLHIYDNAKVLATDDINDDPTLQTAANGRDYTHFKQMTIRPCDHPEHNDPITYTDNGSSLSVDCPYCYTKEPYTFQTAGNWNDGSKWLGNIRPDDGDKTGKNATVKAAATIPNGCTANVGNIDMQDGGSLTIADGGQLLHSNAGVQATVKKSITGHGGNNNGGWYFIASPTVDSLAPTNVANMTTSSYDLYYYHEPTSKWRNYKPAQGNADPGFKIAPQQGYLYAKENTTTLNMTGTLRPSHEAVTIKGLSHAASSPLTGFNLVGNPFACNATVSGSCYTIQTVNGKQVIEAAIAPTVGPCEGVMVQADAVNDSVTFTKVTPATQSNQPNHGSLQITLSQVPEPVVAERGRSVEGPDRNQVGVSTGSTTLLDNAIITFNEGNQLGKFYLGEQNANIYIPQDGEAYAIACVSDNRDAACHLSTNEMPLNFKAKADGTYTITVNPEGVEMGYLHLIDNMTGADVDLLAAGPSTGSGASYTFTAKTTDYESRFKLVFSANGEDGLSTGSGAFAYVNNGEIIITGVVGDACNASLQVIDVTGRIIRRRDALNASSASLPTTGMAPGVYVLRLINGNDVKVQKMVIE